MTDYITNIDATVASYLRRHNMKQAELAKELGMSENTLSWKRRGKHEFTLTEAVNLAGIVGMTLDELIGYKG